MFMSPSLIGLKEVSKTIDVPDVAAGGTVTIDVVFDGNVLLIGLPEVKVDNSSLVPQIINGGKNKIKVLISNTDSSNAVSGAKLSVDAYVMKGL